MAVPVISTTTSILGYAQNEFWIYQPAVTTGAPITSWSWSGLPDGMSVNTSTGRISGSATSTGVYLATVSATNSSGTGTLIIPIGIFSAGWQQDGAILVNVDLNTGAVLPTTIYGKQGTTIMIDVGFTQDAGASLIPVYPNSVTLGLKELDSDTSNLCVSSGDFEVLGSYQSTRYRILLDLTGAALSQAISNNENDAGTYLKALAEIRWKQPLTFKSSLQVLERSSLTFTAQIGQALIT